MFRIETSAILKVLSYGIIAVSCVGFTGCGGGEKKATKTEKFVIATSGSDTMVNLVQMWAEEYQKVNPLVTVEVAGGGSGVGIRDLIQGIITIANTSREMEPVERDQAKQKTGKDPVEFIVAYDALAVYASMKNPVDTLSLEELAGIYGENGQIDKWSQLGVNMKAIGVNDEIVRVSRQNSSGTYAYFREKVLNKKDFKMGSKDMSGSKDVVELVTKTAGAIGYSGMGYHTEHVKFVKVAAKKGEQGYEPSLDNVLSGKYPLARSLLMFTLGQPDATTKAYIDWLLSPAGQEIVKKAGYVPVAMVKR
ncbi:MAG: phosphate ABC transporter substrate-binding protein [Kiritimatiellae bacterium]|nr:phosphate ABC transporter substrate-binding protein [Kiritimatiellia bacterium]MDD5521637.1 phosphate ABC transporter substrate-binding protein [Kiritimatiellia bacterium]